MKIFRTKFDGLKVIKGNIHNDNRGYFREIYKKKLFKNNKFIFWCISKSKKNVVRGLHFQRVVKQNIFISVVKGKIFDVVVDLRKNSKTYSKFYSTILSNKNSKSIYIPSGFAHGFLSLDKENIILYGISNYQSKKHEVGILWNDKDLKIKWPVKKPILSKKDSKNITFKNYKNKFK